MTNTIDDAVIIEMCDVNGVVTERHVITAKAEDGHAEGKCTMWCQDCYFAACGAYENPTR